MRGSVGQAVSACHFFRTQVSMQVDATKPGMLASAMGRK